jgi:cobalt-zinc-cadmium efflux system outer membrane protein
LRVLCIFLFAAVSLAADAQSEPPLTMEEAVTTAIQNNPAVSAAVHDIAAASAGFRSARVLANPEVTFTPALQVGGSDEELLIRQPLEINGTRAARAGAARAQLRASEAQAVSALRSLVFETKSAYVGLFRSRERAGLARESLQFAQEFDRIARRQVEVGARPGIEVTQTSIEVARARQQVTLVESEAIAAQAGLNVRMGRTPEAVIGPITLEAVEAAPPDRESAIRQALTARSEIAVEEAESERFREEARLARAEGLPDIAPQYRAGTVTRGWSDSGVGIGITLPLFDYGSRRERIRQAEEARRAQTDRVTAAASQVRLEVIQALARLRVSGEVLKSYQTGVLDESHKLLDASRIGFQEGKTSIVAVLEAQRTYRTVQSEYEGARAQYALAAAELERATGTTPASRLPQARRTK